MSGYPLLAEGTRPMSVVKDNNTSRAALQELMEQCAGMLGRKWVSMPAALAYCDETLAQTWYYQDTLGYRTWKTSAAAANNILYMPLGTVRTGQLISHVKVVVSGWAVGGSIYLMSQDIDTVPVAPVALTTNPVNPWNTGGAWVEYDLVLIAPFTYTAIATDNLHIAFTPPAGGLEYVLGGRYKIQFGN